MSVAGLKKQFYKASQIMSEKVGGAEGTKLDEDFKDLERRTDITGKAVVEVLNKTSEYLQPNPATRAKLSMLSTVSKIRGQLKSPGYSQPEGLLGESMMKYGVDLGDDTNFGRALVDFGESMKRLADIKDSLDIDVKQNFIDPLQDFIDKDMRDIQHHLKKMEGRRLDYDYKKKRQGKIPDEEIRQALDKFDESKEMSQISMHNMLESDVEQVTQLASFATTLAQYHLQASEILNELCGKLNERVSEANSRPKPKPRPTSDYGYAENSNGGHATNPSAYSHAAPAQYPAPPFQRTSVKSRPSAPCCKAMYDFDPENEGELAFREGDIITLVGQIDENWLEGTVNGQTGYFPNNYVDIIVPLPH